MESTEPRHGSTIKSPSRNPSMIADFAQQIRMIINMNGMSWSQVEWTSRGKLIQTPMARLDHERPIIRFLTLFRTMSRNSFRRIIVTTALLTMVVALSSIHAQGPSRGPRVVSPEVNEGKVTFRILAASAQAVRFSSPDIPGLERGGTEMTKGEEGVWEVQVEVAPGYYRYRFDVDGVPVTDPRNPSSSESNSHAWSLVAVPGAKWMDAQKVPRGAVAEVTYHSSSLKRFRRMHVYTPPGYEKGEGDFPVFYLLHGAFDSDDSWTSVGRAGFILDNLIAVGKAKPMVVVMTAGHTGPFRFGGPRPEVDEFSQDFVNDVMPYIERHYRVRTDRANRAMAGLSMGGAQTINIGIPNLEKFGYLGVYSSGVFGIVPNPNRPASDEPTFEERHDAVLKNDELKNGLELFWFATGKDDFLLETSRKTVEMFRKHGFDVDYKETEGGHTWINWREYLHEFTPLLFQPRTVTGTWRGEVDTRIGLQKYTFILKQDGNTITGKASVEAGDRTWERELSDGKVEGNTISFVETFAFRDNEIRIEYTGEFDGNEIKFKRTVGDFGTEAFVAARGASPQAHVREKQALPSREKASVSLSEIYQDHFQIGVAFEPFSNHRSSRTPSRC